jgi:hypothetical protein
MYFELKINFSHPKKGAKNDAYPLANNLENWEGNT